MSSRSSRQRRWSASWRDRAPLAAAYVASSGSVSVSRDGTSPSECHPSCPVGLALVADERAVAPPPWRVSSGMESKGQFGANAAFGLWLGNLLEMDARTAQGRGLEHRNWKGGRVADCTGLENRRCESIRGFESHPFRQIILSRYLPYWNFFYDISWSTQMALDPTDCRIGLLVQADADRAVGETEVGNQNSIAAIALRPRRPDPL